MSVRDYFKRVVRRAMRPAVGELRERFDAVEGSISTMREGFGQVQVAISEVRTGLTGIGKFGYWRGGMNGHAVDALGRSVPHLTAKYHDELAFWNHLIKHDSVRAIGGPFEEVYGRWQQDRLEELRMFLGLAGAKELEEWCAARAVVEIGAGPYPSIARARWKRAVAIDPLADGYCIEGLLPTQCHCGSVTYIASPGENIPLSGGYADLVVIENCLDHVDDPHVLVLEIWRLLKPGALLWLLVDLMGYSDHMHPNPFSEVTLRAFLASHGFQVVKDRVSDHRSHPQAYGEYRGLLRKPATAEVPAPPVAEAAGAPETPSKA